MTIFYVGTFVFLLIFWVLVIPLFIRRLHRKAGSQFPPRQRLSRSLYVLSWAMVIGVAGAMELLASAFHPTPFTRFIMLAYGWAFGLPLAILWLSVVVELKNGASHESPIGNSHGSGQGRY